MLDDLNPEALRELRHRDFLKRALHAAHQLALEVMPVSTQEPHQVPPDEFLNYVIEVFCRQQDLTIGSMQELMGVPDESSDAEHIAYAKELADNLLNLAAATLVVVAAMEQPISCDIPLKH